MSSLFPIDTSATAPSRALDSPTHGVKGVHHVSFSVANLEDSLDFYVHLLGCKPVPRPEMEFRGAWLQAGAQQVHLLETSDVRQLGPDEHAIGMPDGRNSHVAFVVNDVAELERLLVAHGVLTAKGPGEGQRVFICDPDGHTIELTEVG